LLRRGEHAMRISMVDSNNARGPNVDWITLIPQNHLPKFEYLSGLIAQANGMSSQTLSQTRTILWMSNEDPFDYSSLTDQEIIERYSLVQIYHSTAGDAWANNNEWLSDFHACSWYGVTCSIDMLVTDLMLGKYFDMIWEDDQKRMLKSLAHLPLLFTTIFRWLTNLSIRQQQFDRVSPDGSLFVDKFDIAFFRQQ